MRYCPVWNRLDYTDNLDVSIVYQGAHRAGVRTREKDQQCFPYIYLLIRYPGNHSIGLKLHKDIFAMRRRTFPLVQNE